MSNVKALPAGTSKVPTNGASRSHWNNERRTPAATRMLRHMTPTPTAAIRRRNAFRSERGVDNLEDGGLPAFGLVGHNALEHPVLLRADEVAKKLWRVLIEGGGLTGLGSLSLSRGVIEPVGTTCPLTVTLLRRRREPRDIGSDPRKCRHAALDGRLGAVLAVVLGGRLVVLLVVVVGVMLVALDVKRLLHDVFRCCRDGLVEGLVVGDVVKLAHGIQAGVLRQERGQSELREHATDHGRLTARSTTSRLESALPSNVLVRVLAEEEGLDRLCARRPCHSSFLCRSCSSVEGFPWS